MLTAAERFGQHDALLRRAGGVLRLRVKAGAGGPPVHARLRGAERGAGQAHGLGGGGGARGVRGGRQCGRAGRVVHPDGGGLRRGAPDAGAVQERAEAEHSVGHQAGTHQGRRHREHGRHVRRVVIHVLARQRSGHPPERAGQTRLRRVHLHRLGGNVKDQSAHCRRL
jgi:hypothetical protein